MPADYRSAAAALAIPTSPSDPASSSLSDAEDRPIPPDPLPPWVRAPPARNSSSPAPSSTANTGHPPSSSAARRLRSPRRRPYSMHNSISSLSPSTAGGGIGSVKQLLSQLIRAATALSTRAADLFLALPMWQRALVVLAALALAALSITALVFSHRLFAALGPLAASWRALPGGWVLLWLMAFATAFPPVIGYSSMMTTAGFVYGFPAGWPVAASATVVGSLLSFLASRGILAGYVHRLVGADRRFVALAQVLRRDGLGVLVMIRICPLPFSLSNGFLATIPSIRPGAFAVATALASPKLLVHVFIGSRLALLIEDGDHMTAGDLAINYGSIVAGSALGFVLGLWIYRRTMARAAEIAREQGDDALAAAAAAEAGNTGELFGDGDFDDDDDDDQEEGVYDDDDDEESRLMRRGEADAAALIMGDDDISLWETEDGVVEDESQGQGQGQDQARASEVKK